MYRSVIAFLLIPAMLVLPAPASAAADSPLGWTSRLVVTYATPLLGALPPGVSKVAVDGRRVVVDLGRLATITDLLRFRDPSIVDVRPDMKMEIAVTPSDPSYPAQWDMSDAGAGAADYSVRAPGAWEISTGSSDLVIAVLDTGITAHSEFTGRTVPGYDFISDSRVANDGDGRDNNPSDPGDWITNAEAASGFFAAYGCRADSSSWHGTHVAGTIGATGNNAAGIAGLNWNSKIQPIRVLGKCGGFDSDIAAAIRWAAGADVPGVPRNETPARIINLSLGGPGSCAPQTQEAINIARGLGSIVVVAAGNNDGNAASFSPANCSGVITVAATGRNGKRAEYSNYGSTIEIAAPGGSDTDDGIYSTFNSGAFGPTTQSYASYQGTSMAAPHVAGALSLLLSVDPTLTESEVLTLLSTTATPFPSDSGANSCSTSNTCGAGIVNAASLLAAAAPEMSDQTIDFPEQADRFVGGEAFDPGARATSDLPVTYSVVGSSVCTTNGVLITIRRLGTCVITASQAGSVAFRAAAPVVRSVAIIQPVRPAASVDPIVSATPLIGTPLSMTSGSWLGLPAPVVNLQWLRCSRSGRAITSTRVPSGCATISGASNASYTPLPEDEGKFLRVAETAVNLAGRVTTYSATSAAVQLPPTAPFMLTEPSLSRSLRAGSTNSASPGTYGGSKPISLTYAWFECSLPVVSSDTLTDGCSLIGGANALRYRVPVTLRGRYLGIRVTATNSIGSVTVYSATTGPAK